MLSTPYDPYDAEWSSQEWPWSARVRVRSLAVVQEPSIGFDRDEYHARLGVVLQMARKAARIKQTTAASAIKMTPVSFTRWEAGKTGISAYDLARLVHLYGLDVDLLLVMNPPASKVEIRRRLEPIAQAAQRGVRRGLLLPIEGDPEDGDVPE